MRRDQLVAGEFYAAWHPAEKDRKNAVRVQVLDTRGVYDSPERGLVFTGDQGQGVYVQVKDGRLEDKIITRLQLIRQTWADYEAGKEVAKWGYKRVEKPGITRLELVRGDRIVGAWEGNLSLVYADKGGTVRVRINDPE